MSPCFSSILLFDAATPCQKVKTYTTIRGIQGGFCISFIGKGFVANIPWSPMQPGRARTRGLGVPPLLLARLVGWVALVRPTGGVCGPVGVVVVTCPLAALPVRTLGMLCCVCGFLDGPNLFSGAMVVVRWRLTLMWHMYYCRGCIRAVLYNMLSASINGLWGFFSVATTPLLDVWHKYNQTSRALSGFMHSQGGGRLPSTEAPQLKPQG